MGSSIYYLLKIFVTTGYVVFEKCVILGVLRKVMH